MPEACSCDEAKALRAEAASLRAELQTATNTICEILEMLKAAGIHRGDSVQSRLLELVRQRNALRQAEPIA